MDVTKINMSNDAAARELVSMYRELDQRVEAFKSREKQMRLSEYVAAVTDMRLKMRALQMAHTALIGRDM